MPTIKERIQAVQTSVAQAAQKAGRSDVELIAVSKTHPPEALLEALHEGLTLFGENKVQEARAKIPLLPGRARWHFIGHLQRNKVRHLLALPFELLHGIDSLELAREIDRVAADTGAHPRILLEVNLAAESSKFGFNPANLRPALDSLLALSRLQIEGLMTIPPLAPEPEHSRRYFAALRSLRDEIQQEFRLPLPVLSMGMSADFPVAIEEGATLVRVGSAIFGHRSGPGWRPTADSSMLD